ncbi:MAG: hypothetical protein L0229_15440 [Blastocatellia bacterium]|nr:hypothetical protein [Blastocatellia bacterium]
MTMKPAHAIQAVLLGGLSAGVLDLIGAIITNTWRGVPSLRILQSIASGLLGAEAYKGGFKTAALGIGLHFVIALGAAAVYFAAHLILPFLAKRPFPSGALYGVAVYWFMQLVVLPLSAFPHKPAFALSVVVTGLIVHMLCVGLPIALFVGWYAE